MFDSHCHLNFQAFENIQNKVITDARTAGVDFLMVPGTDIDTSKKAVSLVKDYSNLYAAVGIHPTKDLESLSIEKTLSQLEKIADEEKVKALGEIGLDYYHFRSPAKIQKLFFTQQLKLTVKLDKSAIIHNRHAGEDIIKVLAKVWQPGFERRMVFHCCEPDRGMFDFAISHNIFIGVDGDITYDPNKKDFIQKVPINSLVIETDSPYITPEPLRSEKVFPNEPKYLPLIAEKISEIKGIPLKDVVDITVKNAKTLFGLT